MNEVQTTVIGSYPIKTDNLELMDAYYKYQDISWEKYIRQAVNDFVNAGIDVVSDGQTKDPFVNIFFRKIKGCRIRARPEVIDRVEYEKTITVDDQKYVRKIIPKGTKIIGLLAGPYTLTKSCVDLYYSDEKELAFDFAKVLAYEAKNLEKHVDMISVDEPFFSVDMPDYSKELIKIVLQGVNCKTRLHSCGDVSKIVAELNELPVDILSHEFKVSPKLFDAFKEYNTSKEICLGSVRSDNPKVETVDEIKTHIKRGIDVFGEKIIQISPDCGLRMLTRKNAFEKLKNLVKSKEEIYG